MTRLLLLISILSLSLCKAELHAQDTLYARTVIAELCSDKLHGRGYYKHGAQKAAQYIAKEMKVLGASPLQSSFLQEFSMPANVIEEVSLELEGKVLRPGIDYLVSEDAPSSSIRTDGLRPGFQVQLIDNSSIEDSNYRESLISNTKLKYHWNAFKSDPALPLICVIDTLSAVNQKKYQAYLKRLKMHVNTLFLVNRKLTWSVSEGQAPYVSFEVLRSYFPDEIPKTLKVVWKVKSSVKKTKQFNVVGVIPGTERPDSFLMITAHYDHLGRMGKNAIFYGANDNAAGVAMTLDLLRYYKTHPQRYTVVFVAFAGEEVGLIGSYFYSKNPYHNLNTTRALVNLDLVGTGETGMTMVNATEFTQEFALLDSLNEVQAFVPEIRKRGKAAISDHYFFTELGIPSFFWYQSGPRSAYHDVQDVPETLSLAGYNGTFLLLTQYFSALQAK